MIRHRPAGSGHPYTDDTDQRSPVHPIAGETVRLGVRTSGQVDGVDLYLVTITPDGHESSVTAPLSPVARSSRGQAVDGGHLASAQARLARAAGGWEITLDAPPIGNRVRYRFLSSAGETTKWFEFTSSGWRDAADAVTEVGTVNGSGVILPGTVQVIDDGHRIRRVRFEMPLAAAEHITGLGERYDALDHRGAQLDSVVFEQYKSQGQHRRTYLPMPFAHVVGGSGWGFHLRTSRRAWFDFGHTSDDRIIAEVDVDAPSDAASVLDLALYAGTPTEVLAAFLADVGEPTELPDWVFRLWASGNEWNTQAEVLRQMDLHKEHDIPVGSVVIEAWSDESTFTAFRDAQYEIRSDGAPHHLDDFTFPPQGAWPDPKRMVDDLHDRDIRVHLWQIPLIKTRPHPAGQVKADADGAIRENVLIRETAPDGTLRPYRNRGWWFPLGLMPDLTDDRAARWWTEKRRYLVDEIGIDGFKTDGGEHAWGADLVSLDGRHGDEKNNLFPVAYAKAYGDLLKSSGKAPVTFSRAGFTGSQAHGAFWAGDENSTWNAFRWSMFAGLSAAASGIVYWGWDIAGFSGEIPDAELYLRAMAASVFVPIMQYHSEFNHHRTPSVDRTPWNIAERTGDDRVIPVTRDLTKLRERLRPYLTEQARRTIRTSRPLMRPLYFDFPHDEEVWRHPLQWTLGSDLLVAPVVEPAQKTWSVYVPEGEWINTRDGSAHHQGIVELDAPLDSAVVLCRASEWRGGLQAVFQG